jgi:acyl-CoA dehydrogenase
MLRLSPLRTLQKRSHLSQYRNSSKTTSLPHFLESVQPRSVERNVIKQTIRKFVQVEIVPNIASWEEQCAIPREVFKKAGDVGILGIAMPQIYGGTGGGMVDLIDMIDELGSAGSSGILAALTAHQIALPSLIEKASSTMKDSILPKIISGDIISALSISEPQGGLDHMSKLAVTSSLEEVGVELNTDGSFSPKKSYVLKGEKAFVTNGMIADLIFVAARGKIEGEQSQSGSSMFVVRRNAQGLTATKWSKMGSHCSDTASLSFDYVQVATFVFCCLCNSLSIF